MKRRYFIKTSAVASLALTLPISSFGGQSKLKILMLGGTNYVGPHFVNQALRNGYEVTLFNRGITNKSLFPEVEWLEGNRYPERGKGLEALQGDRKWDVVIDTWQGPPGCVHLTSSLLKNRARQYIYISSIAAFGNYKDHKMTEDHKKIDVLDKIKSMNEDLGYAVKKRASEQALHNNFPDGATVLHVGSIRGESYNDNSDLNLSLYDYHFLLGNDLVLPDDPTAEFQMIDVKDLAEFTINIMKNSYYGDFNIVGPSDPVLYKDYVNAMHQATENLSKIYWVDPQWLMDRGVGPFNAVPNWIPKESHGPGFYTISNQKAINHGLTFRPIFTTLVDGLPDISINQIKNLKNANGYSNEKRLDLLAELN